MSLEERLSEDLKNAMREKDERRLSVIRMIRSGILLEKKKPNAPATLPDDQVIRLIQAHVKKVKEALETAEKVGRPELAADARAEIAIADAYLPAAMSEDELETIVRAALAETGATGPAAMGPIMKAAMAKVGGRADGKRVQETVRRVLGG
ncbi:MAG TPA: GatB/YqeY domain-containing protein [Candidatus Eisenbacteria bacterium]|nr:GatB/YqeY domain-containing protein [Candidatus Eisenbacteria bacterium]